jgi:uncharacterized protein (DUF1015 family)
LADIRPFHGVHYNPSLVKDIAGVLCPPYDVITPLMQQELYQQNDDNFVRIEYGRELPHDKDSDNKYTRASDTLEKWLEQGTLQIDDKPAIYLHDHRFTYQRSEYRHRSITCLVKLEEWDKMVIRPHEGTLSQAKGDRLSMLWTVQANTSPVLALYEDRGNTISSLLDKESSSKPLLRAEYGNEENHYLWSIRKADTINGICRSLASQPLYIADGHHRYESALTYQHERHFGAPSEPGEEPYDFVMMTLVEFSDPGILILPAHRLVRGVSKSVLSGIMSGLETFFNVKQIPVDNSGINDALNLLKTDNDDSVRLLVYGLKEDNITLLELRDDATIGRMMPSFHSAHNRKLDVSIVDHFIIEELMGLTPDSSGFYLSYTHDAGKAVKLVSSREYQLAFLVNPVKPEMIKAIADSGDRMPKKSTYFYPKMPAGLVFYKFGAG